MEKLIYNGLPLFDLSIDENGVFNNISIVDMPAIERNFLKFSEETAEVKFKVNDEQRIVTGAALITDQPIYRRDSNGREFYVRFNEEAIKEMAIRFFGDHSNTNGNVMHSVTVDGVTFFESYLINKERGICPVEFSDLPEGSWIVSAKITNDKVWQLIKEGKLKGFSIDANLTIKRAEKLSEEETIIDSIEDLINHLKDAK